MSPAHRILEGVTHTRTRPGGIGVLQGTALYIAAILGSGLLVLPGLTAQAAGPASILAVAAVILLAVPLAGTFAALSARYPDPSGVAGYVRRAMGPTAARATGYWFCFGVAAGFPVLALLGGGYVTAIAGIDSAAAPLVGLAILLPPFAVNMLGVRTAGWVQFVLTGALTAVVVFVVAAAFPAVQPARFTPFLPHGWAGVGTAISLFVWAFAGWEVGTHLSGEFRNPRRAIPIATAIALAVTGGAYLLLQVVTVGVLGSAPGDIPLVTLATAVSPGTGPVVIGAAAGIIVLGVLNAYLAAFGKLGASLAVAGDLPRIFAPGAEAGGVPRRALLLTFGVALTYFAAAVLTGGDLETFILIHTGNMVSIYAAGMIAALRILPRRTPGWWMALAAAVLSLALLVLNVSHLAPAVLLAAAAVAVTVWRRLRGRGIPSDAPPASERGGLLEDRGGLGGVHLR
ncbi:amino acid permease [Microbacterium sp. SYP-A9085]|nr:amino acid permease [Microbacterium sp. SYP-A9085]